VVAGVIGVKKFKFDVWGDAVNAASRMGRRTRIDGVEPDRAALS